MKMKILSLLCPLLLVSVSLSAQDDRAYIKEQIELWGVAAMSPCRTSRGTWP